MSRHAARLALSDGERAYTYEELNCAANQVAHAILARRASEQEVIGVLLGHTAAAVVALLGVLKAGSIRLALGHRAPAPRVHEILEHAGAALLITDVAHAAARGVFAGIDVLEWTEIARGPTHDPAVAVADEATASLFYTSGSTGAPKGVAVGHGDGLAGARSTDCGLPITPDDRMGLVSDLSFAVARAADMALTNGASVHLYDAQSGGPRGLASWLLGTRISYMTLMASTLRAVLDALPEEAQLPDLRVLSVAGEPLFSTDVRRFRAHVPSTALLAHNYALTETMVVTANIIDAAADVADGTLPVGRPLAGVEITLAGVGDDGVGEVIVRSRSVAQGYWHDPRATAAAFGADSRVPGWRAFRTGDLGRLRRDGMLELVGRADWRVKIRGYRVDPSEAEGALLQLPEVERAVVKSVTRGTSDPRLVAYVVAAPGKRPSVNLLRRALLQKLPPYMVPSAYVLVDSLPLTRTGKVDRRGLPPPPTTRPSLEESYESPRNELERMIVRIWEDLLQVRPIGIHDNFYALGGDSLAAAQAIVELEVRLREALPLLLFAESTATVAAIAVLVRDRRSPIFSGAVPLQANGSRPPFFCVGGGNGEILELGPLGGTLAPEQPFYALPYKRPKGGGRLGVSSLARCHVQQMLAVQPKAPHLVGGYSAGGVTAFEMARQLDAAGTRPAIVVLLDSAAPHVVRADRRGQSWRVRWALGTVLRSILFHAGAYVGLSLPEVWRRDYRFERARWTVSLYRPEPYRGRVVLLRTMSQDERLPRDLGWGELAPTLEIVDIPGEHRSMLLVPHVEAVGAALRRALEGALADGGPGATSRR